MDLPEFEIDTAPPPPIPPVRAPLRPWVWFWVTALLALLVATSLISISEMPGVTKDRAELERVIQKFESELDSDNPIGEPGPVSKEFLLRAKNEIAAVPLKTKGAKGSRERALLIIRQELNPKGKPDFTKLNAAADDIENDDNAKRIAENRAGLNRALKEIYSGKPVTAKRADELRDEIAEKSGGAFPYELALDRLDQWSEAKKPDEGKMMFAGMIIMLVLLGGIGVWILFAVYRMGGGRPVGIPVQGSMGDGDDLGLRMLIFLLCFIGVPILFLPLYYASDESHWFELAFEFVLLGVVFYFITRRYAGVKRTLQDIGFRSTNLGKDVLFGFFAFLANWPVMIVLYFVGKGLFSWIPSGEHPLQREFLEPSARTPLFITAAVIAPLLEETTFRGLLFQGLFLRTRSLFWAVFLSGFAFAAIHPQGGALWPTLGWIGAMGALVTHERGSLVPAITMHALHNSTLLLLSMLAG